MEDREIIGLYLARDERAINETAAKYGRLTRSIVMNILGSAADGEECENDVYLAAWNAIPPARPDNLAAFIGRTARNIALGRVEYNTAQKRSGGISKTLDERRGNAGITLRGGGAGRLYNGLSERDNTSKARGFCTAVLVLRRNKGNRAKIRIFGKQGKVHAYAYKKRIKKISDRKGC